MEFEVLMWFNTSHRSL